MAVYNSLYFLFICTVLFISSCMNEESNSVQVSFIKVVGVYTGRSMVCKPHQTAQDTICGVGVANRTKVILFDTRNIIIEDDLGVYGKNRLTVITDTIIANQRNFVFESLESSKMMKLIFNEQEGRIHITRQLNNGSQILTDFFVGEK